MFQILINSSPILLAMLLGFISKEKEWVTDGAKSTVSFLAFRIIAPFLVIKSFSGIVFTRENSGVLIGVILLVTILLAIFYVIGKVLKVEHKKMGVLVSSLPTFALGPFIYPFVIANYPSEMLRKVITIDIVQFLLILTVSYAIALKYGGGSKMSLSVIGEKLSKNLMIITLIVVMVVNYLGVTIPIEIITLSDFFAKAFSFLAAFLVGLLFDFTKMKSVGNTLFYIILRVILANTVVLSLAKLRIIPPLFVTAFYLSFMAPIATLPSIYAHEAGLDEGFVAQLTIASYAIAIIALPVMMICLQ